MDSLCQFHMVAHKRGAAAIWVETREQSRGVNERQQLLKNLIYKSKKQYLKICIKAVFGETMQMCKYCVYICLHCT